MLSQLGDRDAHLDGVATEAIQLRNDKHINQNRVIEITGLFCCIN
jgi:hypothetical protein